MNLPARMTVTGAAGAAAGDGAAGAGRTGNNTARDKHTIGKQILWCTMVL
jgi:hypothetical protein